MRLPWRRRPLPATAVPPRFRAHVWGNDADGWDWAIEQETADGSWQVIGGRATDNEAGDGFYGLRSSEKDATAIAREDIDGLVHLWRTRAAGLAKSADAITYEAGA